MPGNEPKHFAMPGQNVDPLDNKNKLEQQSGSGDPSNLQKKVNNGLSLKTVGKIGLASVFTVPYVAVKAVQVAHKGIQHLKNRKQAQNNENAVPSNHEAPVGDYTAAQRHHEQNSAFAQPEAEEEELQEPEVKKKKGLLESASDLDKESTAIAREIAEEGGAKGNEFLAGVKLGYAIMAMIMALFGDKENAPIAQEAGITPKKGTTAGLNGSLKEGAGLNKSLGNVIPIGKEPKTMQPGVAGAKPQPGIAGPEKKGPEAKAPEKQVAQRSRKPAAAGAKV